MAEIKFQIKGEGAEAKETLKQVRESGLLLRETFRGLGESALLLGGNMESLVKTVMVAREGLLAARTAAIATGAELATVVPVLVGVAAAVASSVVIWEAFAHSMDIGGAKARKTAEDVKHLADVLGALNALKQANAITQPQFDFYRDLLRGTAASAPTPEDQKLLDMFNARQRARTELGAVQNVSQNPYAVFMPFTPQMGMAPGEFWSKQSEDDLKKSLMARGLMNPDMSPTVAASSAGNLLDHKRQFDAIGTDLSKSLSDLQKQYGALTDSAKQWADAAVQGGLMTRKDADARLEEYKKEYDLRVAAAKFDDDKAHPTQPADFSAIVERENKEFEQKITRVALEAGMERGQNYQQEFQLRKELLDRQLYAGEISERDYTDAFRDAENKRMEAARQSATEQIELQRMMRQNDVDRLRLAEEFIKTNPFTSEQAKAQQLLPLLKQITAEYEKQLHDVNAQMQNSNLDPRQRAQLQIQQTQLGGQIAQGQQQTDILSAQGGFGAAYMQNLAKLQSTWGNVAQSLTTGAFKTITEGVHGMADALTEVIMGTKKAGVAFMEMGEKLLASFIETIIEALMYAYIAIPVLTALGVLSGGATTAQGAGVTIGAVLGAQTAVSGSISGREFGGPIEAGTPYIVGEAGPELILPRMDGTVLPNSAIRGAGGRDIHLYNFYDKQAMFDHIRAHPDLDGIIVEAVKRNMHKISPHP